MPVGVLHGWISCVIWFDIGLLIASAHYRVGLNLKYEIQVCVLFFHEQMLEAKIESLPKFTSIY